MTEFESVESVLEPKTESPKKMKRGRPKKEKKQKATFTLYEGETKPLSSEGKCFFCEAKGSLQVLEKRLYLTTRGKKIMALCECQSCKKKQGRTLSVA